MSKSSKKSNKVATLALSNFHLRIEELEKEHQWLLKQIKKKQTELRNFVEQMRTVALELFQKTSEPMTRMKVLDEEIHQLFDQVLHHPNRKLSKKNLDKIMGSYETLQEQGLISFHESEDDDDLDELFRDIKEAQANQDFNVFDSETQEGMRQESSAEINQNKDKEARAIRQTFLKLASIFHPDRAIGKQFCSGFSR